MRLLKRLRPVPAAPPNPTQQEWLCYKSAIQSKYMRYALTAALCLFAGLLSGQVKPQSGIDKAALETYIRHLLAVMPEVAIKIDDPKPSMVNDLQELDIHLSYMGRTQDETFYLTKDG